MTILTKSSVLAGLQCLKRLYLQNSAPDDSPALHSAGSQVAMEQGRLAGLLARRLFPGGVTLPAVTNDALAETAKLIRSSSVPALFEAAFQAGGVLVRVDVLQRRRRNRWRLIEVKSSTEVKNYHLEDVAVQRHVLECAGVDLESACVLHLNRDYVYSGGAHNLKQLFTLVVAGGDGAADIQAAIAEQRRVLGRAEPPDIPPGRQCEKPFRCEFWGHCAPDTPDDHVSLLPRLSASRLEALLEQGVESVSQIPADFPLTELQQRARDTVISGSPWFSNTLSRELAKLPFPLHFMDFETVAPAIPLFAGMRPYDVLPVQWSLHSLSSAGAPLEHREFLSDTRDDPREPFARSLIQAAGGEGRIVVYSEAFEAARLDDLSRWLPHQAGALTRLRSRLWDLLPFIRKHVYHPAFRGSFSIKCVLPALVPALSYESLDVGNGEQATLAWWTLTDPATPNNRRIGLRNALLEYCRLDTLAMVRLVESLSSRRAAGGGGGA